MVVAYALLEADTPETDRLLEAVAGIEAVQTAHIVAGDVELIARIEAEDPMAVSEVVAKQIGRIDGVVNTETYISRGA
ncbi:AsnC family transcriptional regulator [Halodesulfurarchaeum formicicum]|uniref:AsnC family transcriptional regulator n=1 Tax=Halodesulfurarchaeum formicicum TaxID=1873524 RepID=A0A1D8S719_9EURY|nr:Lrp/AsnC ligand binding domain-containing protein [Halodesulfurarchaeum formicicum]AOW81138.1 AsnC family transcriptional regulator [Halodesulfurarchaeum formicicum]APE96480.1 AsnC family transcriptional regulator [Halodesulfurarchaeum formicicum]